MAEMKTQANDRDVDAFLDSVEDPKRRADAKAVRELMAAVTGERGQMWGDSIVGFGTQHLRYPSGREIDWLVVGFSPRKQNTTIYLTDIGARAILSWVTPAGNRDVSLSSSDPVSTSSGR